MLELPKPEPKRNVRSSATPAAVPETRGDFAFGLAKHLANRSRRRMSLTAENLICAAKRAKKAGRTPCDTRRVDEAAQQIE